MKHPWTPFGSQLLFLILSIAGVLGSPPSEEQPISWAQDWPVEPDPPVADIVKSSYIVYLSNARSLESHLEFLNPTMKQYPMEDFDDMIDFIGAYTATMPPQLLSVVESDPGVLSIERDFYMRATADTAEQESRSTLHQLRRRAPPGSQNLNMNDGVQLVSRKGQYLSVLSNPKPLEPVPEYKFYPPAGEGVTVYVLDQPFRQIPTELQGRLGFVYGLNRDDSAVPVSPYGAIISSLAAGLLSGVAKRANVLVLPMPVQDRAASVVMALKGLKEIFEQHKKNLLNVGGSQQGWRGSVFVCTWRLYAPLYIFADAFLHLDLIGVTVIASAGDDDNHIGEPPANWTTPASLMNVVTVGAFVRLSNVELQHVSYEVARYSNYGDPVNMYAMAPRVSDILGFNLVSRASTRQSDDASQTPGAAALVAGIAAIFTSHERLIQDSAIVRARMFQNAVYGELGTFSWFVKGKAKRKRDNIANVMANTGFLDQPDALPYSIATSNLQLVQPSEYFSQTSVSCSSSERGPQGSVVNATLALKTLASSKGVLCFRSTADVMERKQILGGCVGDTCPFLRIREPLIIDRTRRVSCMNVNRVYEMLGRLTAVLHQCGDLHSGKISGESIGDDLTFGITNGLLSYHTRHCETLGWCHARSANSAPHNAYSNPSTIGSSSTRSSPLFSQIGQFPSPETRSPELTRLNLAPQDNSSQDSTRPQ